MRRLRKVAITAAFAFACLVVFIFANNYQSAPSRPGETRILAHRGLSQTFPADNLENDTCTAQIIYPPKHDYLENTIRSMRESFRLGADMVELDIHPTTDGHFAVFHDWTIDCRTQGHGTTREQSMEYLKTLDIGFGYTADGGKTFPLRGTGVGQMPTLDDVFAAFPGRRFLINTKSNSAEEGRLLAARLAKLTPDERAHIIVYGGGDNVFAALRAANLSNLITMPRNGAKQCLLRYLAIGWTGYLPDACRNAVVPVPVNLSFLFWGWPYRFADRVHDAGSTIWLMGPVHNLSYSTGIDTPALAAQVPENFDGYVWTNEAQIIKPLLSKN